MAPIACVHVPHFRSGSPFWTISSSTARHWCSPPPPTARPLVDDCTPEATLRGIRPGMPLREVIALCPDAVFIPPNPVRDAATAEQIMTALETCSPTIEPGEPGCWYVDLRGLTRHYSTVNETAEPCCTSFLPALRPRVGMAPGKFTAWVAARQAAPGTNHLVRKTMSFPTPRRHSHRLAAHFPRPHSSVRAARSEHARRDRSPPRNRHSGQIRDGRSPGVGSRQRPG